MPDDLNLIARSIFLHALQACDVPSAVTRAISVSSDALSIAGRTLPLEPLDHILIIAIGKAAAPMHRAAHLAFEATLPITSIVVAPPSTLPAEPTANTTFLPGDHPETTIRSAHAARAILQALASASPRTAVLFLISGGASAMVELPLDPSISLDDLAAFHRTLVAAGLPIGQMNALRKHLSAIKGGRLAAAAAHTAAQITLLISDVPPGDEATIASGPTLSDPTTLADCRKLLTQLQSRTPPPHIPLSIAQFLSAPSSPETLKPTDPAFARASHAVLLSSRDLALAAAHAAQKLGFHTEIDPISEGTPQHPELDYRIAAEHLVHRSAQLAAAHPRSCLINTGEVSVALGPHHGEGGRNQQFALYAATKLARLHHQATVLSAGSDGIDGNSPAAGAICDDSTVERAAALGLSAPAALDQCNTSPLLHAIDAQILTGPTGNNLRDLRFILTA